MAEEKNILTTSEARDVLRLDGDIPDSVISFNNQVATSFVDSRSGKKWEDENSIDPEAKACASLVLQQTFYHDADHDFRSGIFDYIEELKMKAGLAS
jgi:hypothetical protein